jgi:hypothetical protein
MWIVNLTALESALNAACAKPWRSVTLSLSTVDEEIDREEG